MTPIIFKAPPASRGGPSAVHSKLTTSPPSRVSKVGKFSIKLVNRKKKTTVIITEKQKEKEINEMNEKFFIFYTTLERVKRYLATEDPASYWEGRRP